MTLTMPLTLTILAKTEICLSDGCYDRSRSAFKHWDKFVELCFKRETDGGDVDKLGNKVLPQEFGRNVA